MLGPLTLYAELRRQAIIEIEVSRVSEVAEIEALMQDIESDRVERKQSLTDKDRVLQAICAFANDMPSNRKPGFIFIGVDDAGVLTDLEVTDQLLLTLSAMRDSGKILPLPHMTVQKIAIGKKAIAMVKVHPSDAPPVRLDGQIRIRVGPRRAIASAEEERRLTERNLFGSRSFDRRPCAGASLSDLLLENFTNDYLPTVVSREVILENHREITQQLASVRLFDLGHTAPTNAGMLLLGADPLDFLPGAYIQFVRFDGLALDDPIQDQRVLSGNLLTQLRQLDELLPLQLRTARVPSGGLRHEEVPDYPITALRELILNAILHRSYEATNSPVRINWFSDRVEIQNPGGLFGHVNPENYRQTSDYRNPVLAEAMKSLGYVERFGVGIARTIQSLAANGNPDPQFLFQPTHVLAIVRANR